MAVTLFRPRYLLWGETLSPWELPEAFTPLTPDEMPPVFTATRNQPFMIDEEDIDFGKELKIPGTPEDEHELTPGLLPPAEVEEIDEEFPANDFDHNFDDGVGKEFGGDFAPEEDDEYELEHAMDEDLTTVPDKIEEIENSDDDVAAVPDDEEIIPEDVDIDD